MGTKAKEAMTAAGSAITSMKVRGNDMVAGFQGMYNQKKITAAFRGDLIKYAQVKHPGKDDLTAEYATDKEIKRLVDGIATSKVTTAKFRQSVLVGSTILKTDIQKAREAIQEIDKLIVAKQQKKDAAGSNPFKKLAAKVQTKSLGDLRDKKKSVDQAIAEVNACTIAITAYAEKKLKAQD